MTQSSPIPAAPHANVPAEERLFALSRDLLCVIGADGWFRRVNPAFEKILGWRADELFARPLIEFFHPDDQEASREAWNRAGGSSEGIENRFRCRDGSYRWLSWAGAGPDEQGLIYAVARDVTERRAAETALRASEARYAHIAANVPGMVYQFAYRPDGTSGYTFVSEGARAMFGVAPEEALRDSQALIGLLHPDDAPTFLQLARRAAELAGGVRWEGRVLLPSGEERFIQVVASDQVLADGTVVSDGLVTDISELHRLEERLRQAQKMEAVGQLAGGVAHDFNNLLTVIQNFAAFALEDLPANASAREDLEQILGAAERAVSLTRQLLAFGRQQILKPRRIDVNVKVTNVVAMLRRIIGEDIAIETRLASAPWPAHADPGQIEQVLMNLALNARDAMPDGGTLSLSTANLTIDAAGARARPGLEPGDYVSLVVEDTGSGIPPEVLPRIFEPFFTTKGPGAGTGLGLAMAYGIVKQSGGHIYADSIPGLGARFTVLLRRTEDVEPSRPVAPTEAAPRGSETILLVEDEGPVRKAVRRMLERQGYAVLEAEGPSEARRLAADSATRIDLLLTDVVMPECSGRALAEELGASRAGLPVLYMTGYTDDEIIRRGLTEPGTRVLEKPFTSERLARAVRAALGSDARATRA